MTSIFESCARCGARDVVGPYPLRTGAHPNSSLILVETPGAHFHDVALSARVCLGCGFATLEVPEPTLRRLRPPAVRRRSARGKPSRA